MVTWQGSLHTQHYSPCYKDYAQPRTPSPWVVARLCITEKDIYSIAQKASEATHVMSKANTTTEFTISVTKAFSHMQQLFLHSSEGLFIEIDD